MKGGIDVHYASLTSRLLGRLSSLRPTFELRLSTEKNCILWRAEHDASVTLYSDTSKTAWGGTLRLVGHTLESRDYWLDISQHINVLEAQPLLHSLLSFREHLTSSSVDVHTDNRVLKSALENGDCRSSEVSGVLKDIFNSCREYNFSLDVYYVPTGENPVDLPSRSRSGTDCMLSNSAWDKVKRLFGQHTFDLMSLGSNCQRKRVGQHLAHFTPCATPESSVINTFAHSLPLDHNIFVFPPFVLIAPPPPPTEVSLEVGFSRRLYYCGP